MEVNVTKRLAKIVSGYYFITGLGFLISSEYYSGMIAHKGSDPVLINLSGMVHFFIGMTVLVSHFKWRKPLEIGVSVSGFFFLIKGISLIVIPALTLQTGDNPVQVPIAMSIAFIAVGLLMGVPACFNLKRNDGKK